jgi:hypothetical protein
LQLEVTRWAGRCVCVWGGWLKGVLTAWCKLLMLC